MKGSSAVSIGLGLTLVAVAGVLVAAGIFVGEQGDEVVGLYRALAGPNGNAPDAPDRPSEFQLDWQGLSLGDGAARGAPGGLIVTAVQPAGPGQLAGVQPGDQLVALNGKPLQNVGELYAGIQAPGPVKTLALRRNGAPFVATLAVAPAAPLPGVEAEGRAPQPAATPAWGANATPGWGAPATPGWGANATPGWGANATPAFGANAVCPRHGPIAGSICPYCTQGFGNAPRP